MTVASILCAVVVSALSLAVAFVNEARAILKFHSCLGVRVQCWIKQIFCLIQFCAFLQWGWGESESLHNSPKGCFKLQHSFHTLFLVHCCSWDNTVSRRDVEENASFMHIVNSFHTFVFCACQDPMDFYSNDTLSSAYPAGGPALEPALMAGPFLHKVWRNIGHLVLTSTGTWAHQRTS